MNATMQAHNAPFSPQQRIEILQNLLAEAMFADFCTPSSIIHISIVNPGNLNRTVHIMNRETGDAVLFTMTRNGEFVDGKSWNRIPEKIGEATTYRFEIGEPPDVLSLDRVLTALRPTQRISRHEMEAIYIMPRAA